jgi:hypothetical protein
MQLANGVVFKYILRAPNDRAVRSLEEGVVKRDALQGLLVRAENGAILLELSSLHIRSWNIAGPDGESIDGDMLPADQERLY